MDPNLLFTSALGLNAPLQITYMHWLQRYGLKTARAWRMKERYQEIHQQCRAGEDPEPLFRS